MQSTSLYFISQLVMVFQMRLGFPPQQPVRRFVDLGSFDSAVWCVSHTSTVLTDAPLRYCD